MMMVNTLLKINKNTIKMFENIDIRKTKNRAQNIQIS